MRRLCGKLVWATRPGRGAMPFLARSLAWLNWGPRCSKYTLPAVLGLMEALAIGITPWRAPTPLDATEETWYVDTATVGRRHCGPPTAACASGDCLPGLIPNRVPSSRPSKWPPKLQLMRDYLNSTWLRTTCPPSSPGLTATRLAELEHATCGVLPTPYVVPAFECG